MREYKNLLDPTFGLNINEKVYKSFSVNFCNQIKIIIMFLILKKNKIKN